MEKLTAEEVVAKLGSLTVLEMIALTRELEEKWGVKAAPAPVAQPTRVDTKELVVQTEFTVSLASVPADKKMSVIKAVRETLGLGLKESKELVESAPKVLKEGISKEESDDLNNKLTAAGAVVEVK
jgi:large subunit ribosomal protein L7/L12